MVYYKHIKTSHTISENEWYRLDYKRRSNYRMIHSNYNSPINTYSSSDDKSLDISYFNDDSSSELNNNSSNDISLGGGDFGGGGSSGDW